MADEWRKAYLLVLGSNRWKLLKAKAIAMSEGACWQCGAMDRPLELHHHHYKTLGHETLADVALLCDDCHRDRHPQYRSTFTPSSDIAQKNNTRRWSIQDVFYKRIQESVKFQDTLPHYPKQWSKWTKIGPGKNCSPDLQFIELQGRHVQCRFCHVCLATPHYTQDHRRLAWNHRLEGCIAKDVIISLKQKDEVDLRDKPVYYIDHEKSNIETLCPVRVTQRCWFFHSEESTTKERKVLKENPRYTESECEALEQIVKHCKEIIEIAQIAERNLTQLEERLRILSCGKNKL